ncbi:hypothetical protein ACH4OW_36240, partial [Streptomyces sp. NPDC017056]|uniref:hypothetical protein n=1 Tax=Streptomyces sp. NPDC017056 TaxID=3364973 RepID=UPI0037B38C9F
LAVLIFAGAFRPFGFFAVPTLPDPFGVSAFRSGPCWSGMAVRLSLFGLSDSIRSDVQSVAVPHSFPIPRRRGCLRLSA